MARGSRWAVPFVLGALLLIMTGYWGYTQQQAKESLENHLGNQYQMAFLDLSSHVEKLQVMLAKGMVSSSPEQDAVVYSDIRNEASQALNNLGQLPLNTPSLTRTAQYLTQVGDFAYTINKKRARGQEPTNKDWDKVAKLQVQAGYLNSELKQMESVVANGQFNWPQFNREANQELAAKGGKRAALNFVKLERNMEQFPTLIYDGPFSDHLERIKPRGLVGNDLTIAQASRTAVSFMDKNPNSGWQAKYISKVHGKIPCYRFTLRKGGQPGGDGTTVDVTVRGGKILSMVDNRSVKSKKLSLEQAGQKATAFLSSRGYKNMVPTYSVANGNIGFIPMAYLQNGVIIYPDLIKVKVALDNGQILGVETMGYLMSHYDRKLPQPKITMDQAKAKLNKRLQVKSARLVLIPTETLKEVMCYEFKTILNRQNFIIYINAENGMQEKILQVIDTPEGNLTM